MTELTFASGLGLKHGYSAGEDDWGGGMEITLRLMNTLVQGGVIDQNATPPGSPSNGDIHIVGVSATGIWSGKDNQIAAYYDATWYYITPNAGWRLWNAAIGNYVEYKSGGWSVPSRGQAPFSPPLAAHFPDIVTNSGQVAIVMTDDPDVGLIVEAGNSTQSGDVPKYVYKPIVNSTWELITHVKFSVQQPHNCYGGVVLGDSTGGKCVLIGWIANNSNSFTIIGDNITGGHNGDVIGSGNRPYPIDAWIKVTYDGTNITVWTSLDGKAWLEQAQATPSSFQLSNAPNQIGLGWAEAAGAYNNMGIMSVPYWLDTCG